MLPLVLTAGTSTDGVCLTPTHRPRNVRELSTFELRRLLCGHPAEVWTRLCAVLAQISE